MVMTKECRPQELPHQGRCLIQCLREIDPQRLFRENTRDVTNALTEILIISGIHDCKVNGAREVITKAFKHYDDIRHCTDTDKPKKSLQKLDLLYELGCKCMMTCVEAQLTYSMIKRVFKAFYSGTKDGSIRNPITEAELIHSQKKAWIHAAKRTARIYAEYEGMFFPVQKKFEQRIREVYEKLYERLKARASPITLESCNCDNCVKRIVPSSLPKMEQNKHQSSDDESSIHSADEKLPRKTKPQTKRSKEIAEKQDFEKLPRCSQCQALKLMCYCNVDKETGILDSKSSQGPFRVRWKLVDELHKSDPCIFKPLRHECPVDCNDLSEMTLKDDDNDDVDDTVCNSDICICDAEISEDYIDETNICYEPSEDKVSTEASDTRTVYSCHMPEPDYTPVMLKDKFICVKEKKCKKKRKPCIKKVKPPKVCKCLPTPPSSKKTSKSTTDSCRLLSGESCTKSSDHPCVESKTTELVVEMETFESTGKPGSELLESITSDEAVIETPRPEPAPKAEPEPKRRTEPVPKPEPKPKPRPKSKPIKVIRKIITKVPPKKKVPVQCQVKKKKKQPCKIIPCKPKKQPTKEICKEDDEKLYAFVEPCCFD